MTSVTDQRPAGKVRRSAWAGQFILAGVGIYVCVESLGLGLWSPLGPGSGFFPFVLGIALVILPLIWFLQERRGPRQPRAVEPSDPAQVRGVVVSLVILAAALPFIGFQVGLFLFLMYHLKLRARISWLKSLVISLCGSVGVFYLFTVGLNVGLPTATVLPLSLIGL